MEKKSNLMMFFVWLGWTLASFACHYCAKLFLKESSLYTTGFDYSVIVLTSLQIIFCLAFTSVSDESNDTATNKYVIFAAHACATFTTNWSLAVSYAASTFAVKLMEPLTSALLQKIILDIKISYLQWISIPCVVSGAMLFAADDINKPLTITDGTILALISNICLSFRNVYMKQNHKSSTKFTINDIETSLSFLVLVLLCGFGARYIEAFGKTPAWREYTYGLLIGSSLFHVIYSYISTVIVLKHCSVVGHAYVNILKRFSVIGLLYVTGSRTASSLNFVGLFICAVGLAIYTMSKENESRSSQIFNLKEAVTNVSNIMKTKYFTILALITMAASVLGMCLAVYLLPGQFSVIVGRNPERHLSMTKPLNSYSIEDFYSLDLVKNPEKAQILSRLLTNRQDVINEAQRIHMNIFKSVLGKYKYAMLFNYSPSENKGDSAIVVGEVLLLRKLNISVVFACPVHCQDTDIRRARRESRKYTKHELVILFHGGGNVIGWPGHDLIRAKIIPRFMRFNIVMFPQSILYIKPQLHIEFCKKLYASHPRLTFVWRDQVSYRLGKELFPRVRSLLSPDIAYQIGHVPRYMAPSYDILWLKRSDKEAPEYQTPHAPRGIRMVVSDWLGWRTARGRSPMENCFLMTTNGMTFLQRGRIVVTDRLHGHILATLLGIPHVYIDNKQRKITNYHQTWTAGVDNIVFANSPLDAIEKAMELLLKLDNELPKIKGYFNNTSR